MKYIAFANNDNGKIFIFDSSPMNNVWLINKITLLILTAINS